MRKRAAIVATIAAWALVMTCSAQERDHLGQGTFSVAGKVVTIDEHATENARVEIRDPLTGTTLQSTYTNPAGLFEIAGVPPGTYLVVANSQLDQAQETVKVPQAGGTVVLRLSRTYNATDDHPNMISVQQLKVPGKARSAYKHAQEAVSKQKLDQAWNDLAKALSIYPQYAEALVLRGILKLDRKDNEGALSDMQAAISSDPAYALGYIAMGAVFNAQAKFDDALRALDRGVALAPNSWQGYFELGKAYLGKGDFSTSLRQLDRAEQVSPAAYAPMHLVKAHALLGLKSYNEAIMELEAYLKQEPTGKNSEQARDTLQKVRAFVATATK